MSTSASAGTAAGVARSTRAIVCAAMLCVSAFGLGASTLAARDAARPRAAITPALIDLNTATPGELELLPRIGPALAERIVADRDQHGPFVDVADLDRVRGIGPKTVESLRNKAHAGPVAASASADAGE